MGNIPHSSNFYAALDNSLSRRRVAGLYARRHWTVGKCSWTDYEIQSPFAELVIEAEAPILMHGPVADVEANADQILAPLREAGVGYTAECYGADRNLLREYRWESSLRPL
jgi:hypothetical protein